MTDRLRILYLADGNSIHTKRWVGWFAQRHDVELLSWPPVAANTWNLSLVPLANGSTDRFLPKVDSVRGFFRLKKAITNYRPHLLHAHFLVPNAWLAMLSHFQPYVTSTWGTDVLKAGPLYQVFNRAALRRAALNTADSQEMLERLQSLGVPKDRLALIQHGVDTNAFTPGAPDPTFWTALAIPAKSKVFLSPRTLRPLYNIATIVKAFSSLAQEFSNVYLVVLTYLADATYENEIRAIVKTGGLSNRIRFLPGVTHEDMPNLYRSADFVVSIPSSDTTAVSLLEALACGRLPIATDLVDNHEWITPGQNGFLVSPSDTPGVLKAFRSALSMDRATYKDIGEANRKIVTARGSMDSFMQQMETHYRRLVQAYA